MSDPIDAAVERYVAACEREHLSWKKLEAARDVLVALLKEARESDPSPDDLVLIISAERDVARIDQRIRAYHDEWHGKEPV